MELEEQFSGEKIIELVKQYSIAIEYYLQNEPSKAKAYQNRMEYLLTNKDTLIKLKVQSEKEKNKKVDNENNNINNNINNMSNQNNKTKQQLNIRKENIKFRQDYVKDQDLSQKINKVLSLSNSKSENFISGKNIINDDLEKQNLNWKEKLKNKKRSNIRTSFKPSIGGSRKKFQSGKSELSLSPMSSDLNLEINVKNPSQPLSEFKTVFEELYDKKENNDNAIEEEKKEDNKIE